MASVVTEPPVADAEDKDASPNEVVEMHQV